jgi:hypothetical protein
MSRTVIDVLVATGMLHETIAERSIRVTWDTEQEAALRNITQMTESCIRLLGEIREMDNQIEVLKAILQWPEGKPEL